LGLFGIVIYLRTRVRKNAASKGMCRKLAVKIGAGDRPSILTATVS
jgi:hypothetical protein